MLNLLIRSPSTPPSRRTRERDKSKRKTPRRRNTKSSSSRHHHIYNTHWLPIWHFLFHVCLWYRNLQSYILQRIVYWAAQQQLGLAGPWFLLASCWSKMPVWYYEKSNLKKTPSYLTGLDFETETRYRREGARWDLTWYGMVKNLSWSLSIILQVHSGGGQNPWLAPWHDGHSSGLLSQVLIFF